MVWGNLTRGWLNRRTLWILTGAGVLATLAQGCRRERDMPERAEMPDAKPVMRAMHQPAVGDSMLDTIPGGEMARGDSTAAAKLLKKKM
jgi:hypothetical protein